MVCKFIFGALKFVELISEATAFVNGQFNISDSDRKNYDVCLLTFLIYDGEKIWAPPQN